MENTREHPGGGVAVGGVLVFASNLATALTGAVFWLLLVRIAGLEAGGGAAAVVSAALIPGSVLGLGLGLAAAREAAAAGCIPGQVAVATGAASLAATLAALALSTLLHASPSSALLGAAVSGLTVASTTAYTLLLGVEEYTWMLYSSLAANSGKLAAGLTLALLGLGEESFLAGYTAFNLLLLATAASRLARYHHRGCRLHRGRLLRLAAGNTIDSLASQLPAALSVYLYALVSHEKTGTGALYLGMMAAAGLAMLPTSLARATLAQGVKTGRNLAAEALAAGLAAATPAAALAAAYPRQLFATIDPALASPENTLTLSILAAASTLLAAINAAIIELNARNKPRTLAAIGAARIATLLTLLPPLTTTHKAPGAAAAYTASLATALTIAYTETPWATKLAAKAYTATIPALLTATQPLPTKTAALTTTIILAHTQLYPYTKLAPTILKAAKTALNQALRRK